MLRWMTAGESHGEALTAVLEGVPAGVRITSEDIRAALARRRLGHGRGARQAFERDELRVLGGIRHGSTIGSPVALQIGNSEWPKWSTVMSADPVDPHDLLIDAGTGDEREIARNRPLTRPRPGHADLPGMLKYDLDEARPVLERASARETAARVALGALAEALLVQVAGIRLVSHVVRIGSVALPGDVPPPSAEDTERLDADPVRCTDPATSAAMVSEIDATRKDGDTLGGVVEVIATGVPVGLGTHVSADCRLDARLAAALMGIQAVKGVEIGAGFGSVAQRGSQHGDELTPEGFVGNEAGGILGGISTGQDIRVSLAIKPTSSIRIERRSIDREGKPVMMQTLGRHDPCVGIRATPIVEAVLALVLIDHCLLHRAQCGDVDSGLAPIPASAPPTQ